MLPGPTPILVHGNPLPLPNATLPGAIRITLTATAGIVFPGAVHA